MADNQYMRIDEAISGKEGKAFATIDGNVEFMFNVRKLEATVTANKITRTPINSRATQHRKIGWEGAGSLTLYFSSDKYRALMQRYIETGVDTFFDIQVTNADPQNVDRIGRQIVRLLRVNLDSSLIAMLDEEAELLEEEVPFTFEGVEYIERFSI